MWLLCSCFWLSAKNKANNWQLIKTFLQSFTFCTYISVRWRPVHKLYVALRSSPQVTGAFCCCHNSQTFERQASLGGHSEKWLMPAGRLCLDIPGDLGMEPEILNEQQKQRWCWWTGAPKELGWSSPHPEYQLLFAWKNLCEVSSFYLVTSHSCRHNKITKPIQCESNLITTVEKVCCAKRHRVKRH